VIAKPAHHIQRKEKYDAYIASEEWFNVKIDIISKRGSRCEACSKPMKPNKLHLHHKTYERLFDEKESDLELLCPSCHAFAHDKPSLRVFKGEKPKKWKKKAIRRQKEQIKQRKNIERIKDMAARGEIVIIPKNKTI
jgi:hypothetical protein